MNLGLASLGERARALLGIATLDPDSTAVLAVVEEGPAATAPEAEEPGTPDPLNPETEETEMDGAEMAAALDAARQEATVAATQAANERWQAVLTHEAAKGRLDLAIKALSMNQSAEDVIALLEVAPAASAATTLGSRMGDVPNPNVPADGGDKPAALSKTWLGDKMAAQHNAKGI